MISVIANSETVSIEKLTSFISASVTQSDDGIAISTTMALRHERRKKSITIGGDQDRLDQRVKDAEDLLLRCMRPDC